MEPYNKFELILFKINKQTHEHFSTFTGVIFTWKPMKMYCLCIRSAVNANKQRIETLINSPRWETRFTFLSTTYYCLFQKIFIWNFTINTHEICSGKWRVCNILKNTEQLLILQGTRTSCTREREITLLTSSKSTNIWENSAMNQTCKGGFNYSGPTKH